jgi:site-specific recombinase XerD
MQVRPSTLLEKRPSPPQNRVKSALEQAVDGWLADGRANGHSARTLGNRRHLTQKFEWWLVNEHGGEPELSALTPGVIRAFLTYLREDRPEGRFGSTNANAKDPARPSTVHTYYRCIRAFVNWCRAEELPVAAAMKNVKPPRVPQDELDHFTDEEMKGLITAARCRQNQNKERDVAILLLLLDTGLRAAELCSLNVGAVDRAASGLLVLGKGNKTRRVYMSQATRRTLVRYLETERRNAGDNEPLFLSRTGGRMTTNGLFQLVERLAKRGGLQGAAGCHKIRRTFAINYLRQGGNLRELQILMGHANLNILQPYTKYSDEDLGSAHRRHSPVDGMGIG